MNRENKKELFSFIADVFDIVITIIALIIFSPVLLILWFMSL